MRLGELGLLVVADGADHGGAEMLCPLRQDEADAAGRGMQQDGVARFDAIGLADQVLRGEALEHHRRRRLVVDAVGQFQQTIGWDQPRFGISTDRRRAVGDAIAGLEMGDARSHFLDHARALAAEPARQLAGINAGAVIDVDEIEPDRGMADARFTGTGLADLHFFPDQNFGSAGLVKADGMRHDVLLPQMNQTGASVGAKPH